MRFFKSPLLNEVIVLLEKGDPIVGIIAAYSENELEIISDGSLSKEDKIHLNHLKKTFGLKEGEWHLDNNTVNRAEVLEVFTDKTTLGVQGIQDQTGEDAPEEMPDMPED